MDATLDFHHAKMTFVTEMDIQIRYYRSGVVKISEDELPVVKQYIAFMTVCKQLDIAQAEVEKMKLKFMIGNLLYETLEAGKMSREFIIIWTTTIHHANMYYNKCYLLCEFMNGLIDKDEYNVEDKQNKTDMIEYIQGENTPEMLEILVTQ